MYIKFENREQGKRFSFFAKEKDINGKKITHTDKTVFATLSEGIKVGERNGVPLYDNDHWDASLCGKAYEKALQLEDTDRICVTEMLIRNMYSKNTHKSYPQITVFDFDLISNSAASKEAAEEEEEPPFN